MVKESTKRIYDCLKDAYEKKYNVTAQDIAATLDVPLQSVNGSLTAMQRMGIINRVPAKIQLDDGTEQDVKFIELTEDGISWDYNQTNDSAGSLSRKVTY